MVSNFITYANVGPSRPNTVNNFLLNHEWFIHLLTNINMLKIDYSLHYVDVIMGVIASEITSLTIVYSAVYSEADQRKNQIPASLAFVRGVHRGPVNSPHKWPVARKCFHGHQCYNSIYEMRVLIVGNGYSLWDNSGPWCDDGCCLMTNIRHVFFQDVVNPLRSTSPSDPFLYALNCLK